MKEYELPSIGGRHRATAEWYSSKDGGETVTFRIPGVGFVHVQRSALKPVKPPLPPEPPLWSVVLAKVPDWDAQSMFQRSDDHASGEGWYAPGVVERFEWAQLCELGTPVLVWIPEGSGE